MWHILGSTIFEVTNILWIIKRKYQRFLYTLCYSSQWIEILEVLSRLQVFTWSLCRYFFCKLPIVCHVAKDSLYPAQLTVLSFHQLCEVSHLFCIPITLQIFKKITLSVFINTLFYTLISHLKLIIYCTRYIFHFQTSEYAI